MATVRFPGNPCSPSGLSLENVILSPFSTTSVSALYIMRLYLVFPPWRQFVLSFLSSLYSFPLRVNMAFDTLFAYLPSGAPKLGIFTSYSATVSYPSTISSIFPSLSGIIRLVITPPRSINETSIPLLFFKVYFVTSSPFAVTPNFIFDMLIYRTS